MFRYLTTVILAIFALASQAQPGSGGPSPTPPTGAPIDGGISILLAGGGAYAMRRLRQRRK